MTNITKLAHAFCAAAAAEDRHPATTFGIDNVERWLATAIASQPAAVEVPYKQATYYADGVYGPDDLAAIWNACVNAHKTLAQQSEAVDEAMVEQAASAIAIEDTGVSWHDVSPRDRTYYVRLARAALAAKPQENSNGE